MVGRPEAWRCSWLKFVVAPIEEWPILKPTTVVRRNVTTMGLPLKKIQKKKISKNIWGQSEGQCCSEAQSGCSAKTWGNIDYDARNANFHVAVGRRNFKSHSSPNNAEHPHFHS